MTFETYDQSDEETWPDNFWQFLGSFQSFWKFLWPETYDQSDEETWADQKIDNDKDKDKHKHNDKDIYI